MDNNGKKDLESFDSGKSYDFSGEAKTLPGSKWETSTKAIPPRDGYWQAYSLLKADTLQRWGFIAIDPNVQYQPDYAGIIALINNCREVGTIVEAPVIKQFQLSMRELKNKLFKCLEDESQLVCLIGPAVRLAKRLDKLKQSEREMGVLTHYVKERMALRRMCQVTCPTIVLKVDILDRRKKLKVVEKELIF